MDKIELVFNKKYVVADFRNNKIIHFADNIEEADNLDNNFVVYSITNNITCYSR